VTRIENQFRGRPSRHLTGSASASFSAKHLPAFHLRAQATPHQPQPPPTLTASHSLSHSHTAPSQKLQALKIGQHFISRLAWPSACLKLTGRLLSNSVLLSFSHISQLVFCTSSFLLIYTALYAHQSHVARVCATSF
jgi:hypothetical protein